MIQAEVDNLFGTESAATSVVPVSARCRWIQSIVIAGTINSVAAAQETLTPGAIVAADTNGSSPKVILIPPLCTYMEIGAFGSNNGAGTAPVVEFWRTHGLAAGAASQMVAPDNWSRLRNVLGASSITLGGVIEDVTGSAGATRYSIDEGTYQQNLLDVRGARLAVARLTTVGTITGNWALWIRFI